MSPSWPGVAACVLLLGGCGNGGRAEVAEQPPRCAEGLEPARSAFGADDVRLEGAVLLDLRAQQRAPWRELWDRHRTMGVVKVPIVVPAGGALKLSVPPESRGIIAFRYDLESHPPARVADAQQSVRLSACRGRHPSVGFPGQMLVARPVCRVPIDYAYGEVRGRLRLSFGRACRS